MTEISIRFTFHLSLEHKWRCFWWNLRPFHHPQPPTAT